MVRLIQSLSLGSGALLIAIVSPAIVWLWAKYHPRGYGSFGLSLCPSFLRTALLVPCLVCRRTGTGIWHLAVCILYSMVRCRSHSFSSSRSVFLKAGLEVSLQQSRRLPLRLEHLYRFPVKRNKRLSAQPSSFIGYDAIGKISSGVEHTPTPPQLRDGSFPRSLPRVARVSWPRLPGCQTHKRAAGPTQIRTGRRWRRRVFLPSVFWTRCLRLP